jgi:hypothetical protein
MRQLHLWIGAWGAIAAIVFGISGFMQNHRAVLKLPQGESTEVSREELAVPESARVSREALRTWLRDERHINVESQRAPGGRGGESREGGSPRAAQGAVPRVDGPRDAEPRRTLGGESRGSEGGGLRPQQGRWNFTGGNARVVTQVEYVEGSPTATVRTNVQSPLAVLNRLHKGVGGGVAWILLGDSFALAMIALGITGLILWSRGRNLRQMAFSVVGVAVIVLLVIGGSAII